MMEPARSPSTCTLSRRPPTACATSQLMASLKSSRASSKLTPTSAPKVLMSSISMSRTSSSSTSTSAVLASDLKRRREDFVTLVIASLRLREDGVESLESPRRGASWGSQPSFLRLLKSVV